MKRLVGSGLVAAVLAIGAPVATAAQTQPTTLHVVGNGRVFVTPDLASVTIATDRPAGSRVLARQRVDRAVGRLIVGLLAIGIARTNIQTSNISFSRETIHQRVVYDAEIDLNVTLIKQIDLLAPTFALAVRDGATSFTGPNFGFSDPSAGVVDATAAALQDARTRADAAAAQLGMHVVGVQSVDISPQSSPLPVAGGPGSQSGTRPVSQTPVLPGEQEVDASVDVVYLLGS